MTEDRIRSYHRAWTPELKMYGIGDIRFPRPVPARFFAYVVPLLLLSLFLSHLIGVRSLVDLAPWWLRYGLPLALAWLFTLARIQGRWFHSELRSRVLSWRMPAWIASCWWPVDDGSGWVRLGKVRLCQEPTGRRDSMA